MEMKGNKLSWLKANIFGLFMVIDNDDANSFFSFFYAELNAMQEKGNMQKCKKCKKWMCDTCYLSGHLPQAGSLAEFRNVS